MPKGKTGNPFGRPKGKPNKVTKDLRAIISKFINMNIGDLQAAYSQLEPKDKLIIFERLLPYVLPKLQSQNITIDAIGGGAKDKYDGMNAQELTEAARQIMESMED